METPTTWNDAALAAVRTMVARPVTPATLPELRDAYETRFGPDATFPAADAWLDFGATARASSVTLAGRALLWGTVLDTVIAKQRDYGKANILRFGQTGLEVRVHDKLARLEHLAATGARPEHESVADSVLDLVGYSVLGVLVARDQFGLALV